LAAEKNTTAPIRNPAARGFKVTLTVHVVAEA
jgi:hypothetical protein